MIAPWNHAISTSPEKCLDLFSWVQVPIIWQMLRCFGRFACYLLLRKCHLLQLAASNQSVTSASTTWQKKIFTKNNKLFFVIDWNIVYFFALTKTLTSIKLKPLKWDLADVYVLHHFYSYYALNVRKFNVNFKLVWPRLLMKIYVFLSKNQQIKT